MQGHGGLITSIIHEKPNEHIQKVVRHPPVPRWALIKVYLFGIWIMNKHCGEMAAINLSLSPSYSKPRRIRKFQFLIPIFHYITNSFNGVPVNREVRQMIFSYETLNKLICQRSSFLTIKAPVTIPSKSCSVRDMCAIYTVELLIFYVL